MILLAAGDSDGGGHGLGRELVMPESKKSTTRALHKLRQLRLARTGHSPNEQCSKPDFCHFLTGSEPFIRAPVSSVSPNVTEKRFMDPLSSKTVTIVALSSVTTYASCS